MVFFCPCPKDYLVRSSSIFFSAFSISENSLVIGLSWAACTFCIAMMLVLICSSKFCFFKCDIVIFFFGSFNFLGLPFDIAYIEDACSDVKNVFGLLLLLASPCQSGYSRMCLALLAL